MRWIALQAWLDADGAGRADPGALQSLAWQALSFTPRVTLAPDAALMEVSASLRLFGGLRRLLEQLNANAAPLIEPARLRAAPGTTSLMAMGRLRLGLPWAQASRVAASELPLAVLDAALPHLDVLERLGCRRWDDLRCLPRDGLARRFGQGLLDALDQALGERPESHRWLQLPEVFEARLELPFAVEHSSGLLFALNRLLLQLKAWLLARSQGVLGVRVVWQMDARRGVDSWGELVLRLGEPTQDVGHLARLAAEHLARVHLPAPAQSLSLHSLETISLDLSSLSLLPDEQRPGESLGQLIERLNARLGPKAVLGWAPCASHVPERMQQWQPAPLAPAGAPRRQAQAAGRVTAQTAGLVGAQPSGRWVGDEEGVRDGTKRPKGRAPTAQAAGLVTAQTAGLVGAQPSGRSSLDLMPTWLLHQPLRLQVQGHRPCYEGPLILLAGPQRLETSGWHGLEAGQGLRERDSQPPVMRDYFIARSQQAGLLWIFRERLPRNQLGGWFLHGLFA